MPTLLGLPIDPINAITPLGLSREDHYLYSLWRHLHSVDALSFYFNVRLGAGRDPGEDCTDDAAHWWYLCTAKRADLIAEYEDIIEIVEFRFNANANAVGRLQMYRNCWAEDPVIDKPVHLRLVTNVRDRDVGILCEQLGIIYEVLP